ncbi:MAG: hypothetical protein IH595_01755 [Bacteroidales bacterium]|nr:hypothetical protein [Bacteroidales bacterium]
MKERKRDGTIERKNERGIERRDELNESNPDYGNTETYRFESISGFF